MKKIISIFLLFICILSASAQTKINYWISFTDKNNSPYSVDKPEAFLSDKAIARRKKQNISVNISDVPVNTAYLNDLRSLGLTVVNTSKWLNAATVTNVSESMLNSIKAFPFVKEIKKIVIEPSATSSEKFNIENTQSIEELPSNRASFNYGPSFFQADQIGMVCMHDMGFQGQGMTIAVLDAGFFNADSLPAFDSLRMENRLLGCRDIVVGDTLVFEDWAHGMNVLSCMASNLPGQLIGTAPKASYWLLRTEDSGSESLQEEIYWLVGSEFADSVGVDIINSSLGYSYFDNAADNHTYADMDGNTTIVTKAADLAAEKGIFVCSSAGNSAGPPWYKITAPADADSILSVGAVDSAGFIANFSSRGPTSDGRIKPNTCARGVATVIAANTGGGITTSGGTSFASPVTAGAVACLWQAHPTFTNMEILYAVQESASQFASPDTIMGYGIPNFCTAHTILSVFDDDAILNDLNVYPNPFTDNLDLVFYSKKKQDLKIALTDISGRIIQAIERTVQAGPNHYTYDVEGDLAAGLYILSLTSNDGQLFKKIIKQ